MKLFVSVLIMVNTLAFAVPSAVSECAMATGDAHCEPDMQEEIVMSLLQQKARSRLDQTILERTAGSGNSSGSCSTSCNNGCCTCAPENCNAKCSAQSNQDTCYDQHCNSNSNSQSTSCSVSCSNGVCSCAGNGCGADKYKEKCKDWTSPYEKFCSDYSGSKKAISSFACLNGVLNGNLCCSSSSLIQTAQLYHEDTILERTAGSGNSSGSCSTSCNNGCCTCAPENCNAKCSAQSNQDTCYDQHCNSNSNSNSQSCSVSCSNGVCSCAGNGCGADKYKEKCKDWKSPYETLCATYSKSDSSTVSSTSAGDCSDITESCTDINGPPKCKYSEDQLKQYRSGTCPLADWPAIHAETSMNHQNCDEYAKGIGCDWTARWNCVDQGQTGGQGAAGKDGTLGYCCCCAAGYWKTHMST